MEATYGIPPDKMERLLREQFRACRATLRDDHRHLLERSSRSTWPARWSGSAASAPWPTSSSFKAAIRTTRCSCSSRRATASVLEDHLPASRYRRHGQRVVSGKRMMQAASDIYLGWTEAKLPDTHHFYWRQLRDMKGSPDIETMAPTTLGSVAGARGPPRAGRSGRWGSRMAVSG